MTPVNKKRRVSYPPEAGAEIAELRRALQQSQNRVAGLEATIKSIQESLPPKGHANEKEDQPADLTSLDGNAVECIAKFLDGISLLNWVKACRSALISPSLFLKHTVRKHMQKPIDSECFFSESPLENQEELRCEFLSNLIYGYPISTMDELQRWCPDVVGNVAEWLDIDANSRYAKCMALFLNLFIELSSGALSTDILSHAELIGFRCLPSVSTLLCWKGLRIAPASLFDILAAKTSTNLTSNNEDLYDDCYNYRTSKLPSLATLINNAKAAIERELEQDSDQINDYFCNELIGDIEHEQSDTNSVDIEAWLDSDNRQRYNSARVYTSRKPECEALREDLFFNHHRESLKECAGEEMKKYKQEVFEALDSLSEQDAGFVDPDVRLSKEKFDEVFISAMPSFMRNSSFCSWSRSGANILQQIVEQIHFGSLWKFPVQHESLILGDSRWNGILLLSEQGMSVMATCEEMDAAVDDDDDSEYEPECETVEEE